MTMTMAKATTLQELISEVGQLVPRNCNASEALVAAGLDWKVVTSNLTTKDGQEIGTHFATVRLDTGEVFGVVKGRYKTVQNEEYAAFLTDLFHQTGANLEALGDLKTGGTIWFLAKCPSSINIKGVGVLDTYYLATSSHDGTGSVALNFVIMGKISKTTYSVALPDIKSQVSLRHTKNIKVDAALMAKVKVNSEAYWDSIKASFAALQEKTLKDGEVEELLLQLFPEKQTLEGDPLDTPALITARYRIALIMAGDVGEKKATRWNLFNAVCQYIDQARPIRGASANRWVSSNFAGAGELLRQQAFDILSQ